MQTLSGIMRKGFWIWQFTAWTAVVILALVTVFWEGGMTSPSPPGIFPVRSLDVRMERYTLDPFVSQMRAFGEAFGFQVLVKDMRSKPHDIFVKMERPDIDLVAA